MSADTWPRPGVGPITFGAVFVGLSAARLVTGWNPGPGWLWFEFAVLLIGGAMVLWGWLRLQRAKAARPDVSWWKYLQTDLIGIGIVITLFTGLGMMPSEDRRAFMDAIRDFSDALSIARGRP